MSLALAAAVLAATPAPLPACSWNRPGHNPFMGDVVAAVDRYTDIPAPVRTRLKARMAERRYDEIVSIRRDAIVGRARYGSAIRDMHFGTGQVCGTVNRMQWTATAEERGLVYCEADHCILVPTVCRNVSRIDRRSTAAAQAADAAPPAGDGRAVAAGGGAGGADGAAGAGGGGAVGSAGEGVAGAGAGSMAGGAAAGNGGALATGAAAAGSAAVAAAQAGPSGVAGPSATADGAGSSWWELAGGGGSGWVGAAPQGSFGAAGGGIGGGGGLASTAPSTVSAGAAAPAAAPGVASVAAVAGAAWPASPVVDNRLVTASGVAPLLSPVPEPGSAALLALGGLVLAGLARRRR
jgi:hypothetical protein